MAKQITLRLDDNLARQVDSTRGEVPRERWIRGAIQLRLASQQDSEEEDAARTEKAAQV